MTTESVMNSKVLDRTATVNYSIADHSVDRTTNNSLKHKIAEYSTGYITKSKALQDSKAQYMMAGLNPT